MSDWSSLSICPQCGAANPHDGVRCVKCRTNLKIALAQDRATRDARARRKETPKGSRDYKPVDELTADDLTRWAIWEFDLASARRQDRDETWVKPVKRTPVRTLANRIAGTEAHLACGQTFTCMLGNVSLNDLRKSELFLSLTLFKTNEDRFHLARYFDFDYRQQGPKALAEFLNMKIDQVFPISYDISSVATGLADVLKGIVRSEPVEKLTREQIIQLSVE